MNAWISSAREACQKTMETKSIEVESGNAELALSPISLFNPYAPFAVCDLARNEDRLQNTGQEQRG